jgi:hypothetical protein
MFRTRADTHPGYKEGMQDLLASLRRLSDAELIARVRDFAARERGATVLLVAHLAELDTRDVHFRAGHGSLFAYCRDVLGLAEQEAYNRITVARAARRFPVILELLEGGTINLTTVRLLAAHLTPANHRSVLESARGKTKLQVEEIAAALWPRPDAPSFVRKLPAAKGPSATPPASAAFLAPPAPGSPAFVGSPASPVPPASPASPAFPSSPGSPSLTASPAAPGFPGSLCPASFPDHPSAEGSPSSGAFGAQPPEPPSPAAGAAPSAPGLAGGDTAAASPSLPAPPLVPATRSAEVTPLSPDRYRVQVTIGGDTLEKLRLAKDLLRHAVPSGDEAVILDRALTALLTDLAQRKFAAAEKPRPASEPVTGSRHIPAEVKRTVWLRDLGRCAFVGTTGRRCIERAFLEFHHVRPYALGGEATVTNIQLRCRNHNAFEARLYFPGGNGEGGAGSVREATAPYATAEPGTCCASHPRSGTRSRTSSRPAALPGPAP